MALQKARVALGLAAPGALALALTVGPTQAADRT
jgi:hypothetical protein